MSGSPTVLLISQDRSLVEVVRDEVDAVPGRRLVSIAETAAAVTAEMLGDVGLILIHQCEDEELEREMEMEPVAWLLWLGSTLRRPIPVLVLTEDFDAGRALAYFRLGVADVLSRSHHLDRIGALISALSLPRPNAALRPSREEEASLPLPIAFM